MQPTLDYRSSTEDVRHPWRATLESAAMGIGWGLLPIGMSALIGWPDFCWFALYLALISIAVGILAGALTIWTRKRSGGSETPFGLIGTYYAAIQLCGLGISIWAGLREMDHIHSMNALLDIAGCTVGIQIYLLAYPTLFGFIAIPFCYLCRQRVWETYMRSGDRGVD